MKPRSRSAARGCILLGALALGGCASLITSATSGFTESLGDSILDNPDVEMVRDGAPSFLLLMDGLLASNPNSVNLLLQSAQLNSAYAAAFVDDPARAQLLQAKSLDNAERAVCLKLRDGCDLRTRDFSDYEDWLEARGEKDVAILYRLGSSWAGWIQANSEDFAAIAELGRVKALMQRLVELDEGYDYGGPHLYMGVFETLLPPALGGRPELGRKHFERAIELADGRYFLAQVFFAEQYARLVFDRELHDQLLEEVVKGDPAVPGLTLINTVAQQQAQQLLDSADDYF
jgi:hypothetical protein